MKQSLLICALLVTLMSCSKEDYTPQGPTDVRVRNLTDQIFENLTVTLSDTTVSYGTINSGGAVSDYHRFPKAFPKAEITCTVSGETFTTGPAPDIYMQYLGPDKVTYEVYISNFASKTLSISNVIHEEPIE